MEANEIMNLVGNGFYPIVISGLFFWWFTQDYKREQEQTREIINELKETVNGIKEMAGMFAKFLEGKDDE